MALHRDIHWIGRQWAVTGHGMQLIDQKLQGFFDIEVIRLWDESLIASMHAKEWLNAADFDKGLAVARARFPQSTLPVTPRPEAVSAPAIKPLPPLPPRRSSWRPAHSSIRSTSALASSGTIAPLP